MARFRNPDVRAGTTPEDLLAVRTKTMQMTVGRELSDDEIADYTSPWTSPARCRSWMAMAGAADARLTTDLVPGLPETAIPARLVWGRDDDFQKVAFARRYVREISGSDLVEVTGRHIPTEDSTEAVASAMPEHLTG